MKTITRKPTHPGEIIADVLADIGKTKQQAAIDIDVWVDLLSSVMEGESSITPHLAFKIQKGLGISAHLLASMQFNYDFWMAEKEFMDNEKSGEEK